MPLSSEDHGKRFLYFVLDWSGEDDYGYCDDDGDDVYVGHTIHRIDISLASSEVQPTQDLPEPILRLPLSVFPPDIGFGILDRKIYIVGGSMHPAHGIIEFDPNLDRSLQQLPQLSFKTFTFDTRLEPPPSSEYKEFVTEEPSRLNGAKLNPYLIPINRKLYALQSSLIFQDNIGRVAYDPQALIEVLSPDSSTSRTWIPIAAPKILNSIVYSTMRAYSSSAKYCKISMYSVLHSKIFMSVMIEQHLTLIFCTESESWISVDAEPAIPHVPHFMDGLFWDGAWFQTSVTNGAMYVRGSDLSIQNLEIPGLREHIIRCDCDCNCNVRERLDTQIMELDRTCNRNIVLAFSCIQRGAKTTFKVDMLCITRAGGSSRKRKVGEEDAKDSRYTWTREKCTAFLKKRIGFYPIEIPFCCLI